MNKPALVAKKHFSVAKALLLLLRESSSVVSSTIKMLEHVLILQLVLVRSLLLLGFQSQLELFFFPHVFVG